MLAVSEKNKTNVGIREHNNLPARSATPCLATCDEGACGGLENITNSGGKQGSCLALESRSFPSFPPRRRLEPYAEINNAGLRYGERGSHTGSLVGIVKKDYLCNYQPFKN